MNSSRLSLIMQLYGGITTRTHWREYFRASKEVTGFEPSAQDRLITAKTAFAKLISWKREPQVDIVTANWDLQEENYNNRAFIEELLRLEGGADKKVADCTYAGDHGALFSFSDRNAAADGTRI